MVVDIVERLLKILVSWPTAVIVVVIAFRKPLSALLEKGKLSFKKGDLQIESSPPQGKVDDIRECESSKVLSKTSSSDPEDEKPLIPVENKSLLSQVIDAAFSNDLIKADELFGQLQEQEANTIKRDRNKFFYQYIRFLSGDSVALSQLREIELGLGEKHDAIGDVYKYIGMCYDHNNDLERATEYYKRSIAAYKNSFIDYSIVVKSLSELYIRFADYNTGLSLYYDEINACTDDSISAKLYESLGTTARANDDYLIAAFAFEKALSYNSNSTELHFNAAYSYSKAGYYDLSMLHYLDSVIYAPRNAGSLNNLGVAYQNLSLPIHAIIQYCRAVDENNTLASANLAYMYMNAGFYNNASTILIEAQAKDEVHVNVPKAIYDLSVLNENEEKKQREISRSAKRKQQFFSIYFDHYVNKCSIPFIHSSEWITSNGFAVTINSEKNMIELLWNETNTDKYRVMGVLHNSAAMVEISKMGYSILSSMQETSYQSVGKGFMYYLNNQAIYLMVIINGQVKEYNISPKTSS